jgi:phosphate-selective porin OprO/OprP
MNVWLQRLDGYGPDVYFSGGYLYASYFLTGEYIPWNRGLGVMRRIEPREEFFFGDPCEPGGQRGLGAWQIALRLSYADFNDKDIFGGYGQSITAALNWYWNAHARLQMNYIVGRVDDRMTNLAIGAATVASGDYQIFGVRAMIDF